MDEEETIWRLDATSLSGFAMDFSSHTSAQHEIHVQHNIDTVDIQLSQTFETHRFPCHLQLILSPRSSISPDPPQSGLVLLLPLCNILNLVISDHDSNGQSLRFKLAETKRHQPTATRQILSDDGPGRMYGPNEDDPYHLLGLLKFREFVVRNAGGDGRLGEVVTGWAECLQRNAAKEFNHHLQILREDENGWWRIIGEEDDGGMGITVKKEVSSEGVAKMEDGEVHGMDVDGEYGTLRTPSLDISDGTDDGEIREPERNDDLETPSTKDTLDHPKDSQPHSPSPSRYATRGSRSPYERSVISILDHRNDDFRSADDFYDDVRRPSAGESSETSPEERHYSRSNSRSPCRGIVNHRRNERSPLPYNGNRFDRFATGPNSIHSVPIGHGRSPRNRFKNSSIPEFFESPSHFHRNDNDRIPLASRISDHHQASRDFRTKSSRKCHWPYFRNRFPKQSTNSYSKAGKSYDSYRPGWNPDNRDQTYTRDKGRYGEWKRPLEIERRE